MPQTLSRRPLVPTDAPAIAAIDAEARRGDFLPSLGDSFLSSLYTQLLRSANGWGHGVFDSRGVLSSFVIATSDTEEVFRQLSPVRNGSMFLATARALVRRPAAIIRMAESLLYTSRESVTGVAAELVVIGTRHDLRGQGHGRMLVEDLAREFTRRNITRYRLTVKSKNTAALRFYSRLGFEKASEFNLYGESWHVLLATPVNQLAMFDASEEQQRP